MLLVKDSCTMVPILILMLLALLLTESSGFVPSSTRTSFLTTSTSITTGQEPQSSFALSAKATKQKKQTSPSSSGGFGKTEKDPSSKASNDFAAFPALEKSVADTLVASPLELLEPGVLPAEVYERLDQIYGFPAFNFEDKAQESSADEAMSFSDLISSGGGGSSNNDGSGNMADLLNISPSSATATASSSSATSKTKASTAMDAIANLPPFTEFRVLHMDPLVLAIDDFLTNEECDRYVTMTTAPTSNSNTNDAPFQTRSKTVGKDAVAKAQRTSTTWFHHYKYVPELMAKASRLLGLNGIDQWEEPQTVRYRRNEKFTWHLDALSPTEATESSGQRLATLLVYLTDLTESEGGATMFRDLGGSEGSSLRVRPKKGSALVFFPAAGGIPNIPFDIRTLHCGEAVGESSSTDKWISQLWLRESTYAPTAPPGNLHASAKEAIAEYCGKNH